MGFPARDSDERPRAASSRWRMEFAPHSSSRYVTTTPAAFLAPQPRTIGETLNAEAHTILRRFLSLLKRQTHRQSKIIEKNPAINLGDAIEAVATAANERKAGQQLSAVRQAMAAVAATDAFGVESAPTKRVSAEVKRRLAYRKGMTPKMLAQKAGVSLTTAKRYIRKFTEKPRLLRGKLTTKAPINPGFPWTGGGFFM